MTYDCLSLYICMSIILSFTHVFYAHIYTYILVCLPSLDSLVGTIMTISKDRVKPSPLPDSWKLNEIFATGVVLGTYLALMTVLFFWAAHKTDFFPVSVHNIILYLLLILLFYKNKSCYLYVLISIYFYQLLMIFISFFLTETFWCSRY